MTVLVPFLAHEDKMREITVYRDADFDGRCGPWYLKGRVSVPKNDGLRLGVAPFPLAELVPEWGVLATNVRASRIDPWSVDFYSDEPMTTAQLDSYRGMGGYLP